MYFNLFLETYIHPITLAISVSIRVYVEDKPDPLPDESTIIDHEIKNDDVLYLAFRKSGFDENDESDSAWEVIEVDELAATE